MLFLEMLTKNSPSKTKKVLAYMDDPPLIVQLQEQIKAKQANEKKARESQGKYFITFLRLALCLFIT